jgi:hypothetical protein
MLVAIVTLLIGVAMAVSAEAKLWQGLEAALLRCMDLTDPILASLVLVASAQ